MSVIKYLDKLENLEGKEIIVTGGTSGIGLSIVQELLYKHADVVILARDKNKAKEVKKLLEKDYPKSNISFIFYDQSDLVSIDEAIKEIEINHPSFYALIFNAGTYSRVKYNEELSPTMKTNFVGTAYFVKQLLPRLKGQHRLILQGSLVAGIHIKKIKSLEEKTRYLGQYNISKAGVEALYYHYSNIDTGETSFYLIEPGLTSTDIVRYLPTPIRQIGKLFLKIISHSNKKAALTALLALQSYVTPSYIVPRSLFTVRGYPKIKKFPKKRQRTYLLDLLDKYI